MTLTDRLPRQLAMAAAATGGALMLAAPSASAPAEEAPQPQPGYWEYSTRVLGIGETETKCVRQSEIDRFFGGLSTRRWSCTYPVREVGGGNARFEGICRDRRDRTVQVRLRGPYEAESFRFTGGAQLARGTPFIPASITARRLSAECPANAEYF
ncbi:MAG: DUF3617 domain-containing protein [Brevundimonas sp.]|jgi:hypothetical protein|uniref:DUF3617 domain-containing protein n=1 Tax=Brevundimonas sp. TaxID=1871086 RepID=UPI0022BF2797|nr:DUF3617 family protein [Brevundimonas sp.]MCZ8194773.1 hypothetical protein [Brevundimonas sp.]